MASVYYLQTDIVCLIILAIVYLAWNNGVKSVVLQYRLFNLVIMLDALFCIADLVAWYSEGKSALFMRFLAYGSNILYFMSVIWLAFIWTITILLRTERIENIKSRRVILTSLPAVLFSALVILNPLTGWVFSMSEDNVYTRGPLIFLHWAVAFVYILYAEFILYDSYKKTDSIAKRDSYRVCLGFSVVCFIVALPQFVVYGVVTSQVGITLAILFLFSRTQMSLVKTDPMTGIQNRRGLMQYIDMLASKKKDLDLSAVMIDIDDFKMINDTYGHIIGDNILRDIAYSLREICTEISTKCCLARYGGDEFLIICQDYSDEEINMLLKHVQKHLENNRNRYGFELKASCGVARKVCGNSADIEALIKAADVSMYSEKEDHKAGR